MRWSIEPKAEADNTGRIMSRKMIVVKKAIKVAMKTKRYSENMFFRLMSAGQRENFESPRKSPTSTLDPPCMLN